MNKLFFLIIIALSFQSHAFLLVHPDYRLSNPKDTVVNIGQGGCQGNGISNSELMEAVSQSIDNYWNTIPESNLKLRTGSEVDRTVAQSGEILVFCSAMGASGPAGVAYPDPSKGAAEIHLNSDQFVPGGYINGAVTGVLAHEMGHAIGLDHSGDPASVMTYEAHAWRIVPKYLSQDDKDGVAFLYPRQGQLGGLIPGCSVIAKDQQAFLAFTPWNYVMELFFIFAVLMTLKLLRYRHH